MIYGQGIHGRVIDVSNGQDRTDKDTFAAYLQEHASDPILMYVLVEHKYQMVSVEHGSDVHRALIRALSKASKRLIVKMFVESPKLLANSSTSEESFSSELRTTLRLRAAFGSDLQRLTVIRSLDVSGMAVEAFAIGRVYFMVNGVCASTIDEHTFDSYASVCAAIHQILEAFGTLHRAQLLHSDVKGANMMICESSSFKLIDWGATASFEEIRQLCMQTRAPRNYASPLAWYAWGITDDAPDSAVANSIHLVMHAKIVKRRSLFAHAEYQQLTDGAFRSYRDFLSRAYRRHNGLDASVRGEVLRDMLPSFDLYNFGLVVAGFALSVECLDVRERQTLMDLAVRLTHYAHPEFVGTDANSARAMWSSLRV